MPFRALLIFIIYDMVSVSNDRHEGLTVNRLTKRRRHSQPPTQEELEEREAHERKMLAAQLIGLRIVNGISYAVLLEQTGRLMPPKPGRFRVSKRAKAKYLAKAEEVGRQLDANLVNERFSLFQRYARVVGCRLEPAITRQRRPTPLQVSRYIRGRHKLLRSRLCGRTRRRLVA